jgi:DNA-directed RNA polymerase subunit K/omega
MPSKKSKLDKKSTLTSSDTIESDISSESELSEESFDEKTNDADFDSDEEEYNEVEEIDQKNNDELKNVDKNEDKEVECFFKYDDDNDNDFDENENITETFTGYLAQVPDDERISINRMTKYEYVRLLGTRTKQLAMGAKPMIKNVQGLPSKEIALLELKNNTTPLIIKRPLPNKKYELWKISELIKDHLYD